MSIELIAGSANVIRPNIHNRVLLDMPSIPKELRVCVIKEAKKYRGLRRANNHHSELGFVAGAEWMYYLLMEVINEVK